MTSWDGRGAGSREYTPAEYSSVVRVMIEHHRGPENRMTYETLLATHGELAGIGGRTLRAILSAADGVAFVLASGDAGVFVAETWSQAEPYTRRLLSQARRMADRAERRRQLAAGLTDRQTALEGF